MKEFIEKLIGRLEERKQLHNRVIAYEQKSGTVAEEFQQRKAVEVLDDVIKIVNQLAEEYNQDSTKNNQGWIPVTERMPEDCDHRFYMCIVENHEEDLPMFCQYEEDYGFGFWQDFYDEHTLGFLDSEFRTNEELGYEKVIAWQPLPEPYKPTEQEG